MCALVCADVHLWRTYNDTHLSPHCHFKNLNVCANIRDDSENMAVVKLSPSASPRTFLFPLLYWLPQMSADLLHGNITPARSQITHSDSCNRHTSMQTSTLLPAHKSSVKRRHGAAVALEGTQTEPPSHKPDFWLIRRVKKVLELQLILMDEVQSGCQAVVRVLLGDFKQLLLGTGCCFSELLVIFFFFFAHWVVWLFTFW